MAKYRMIGLVAVQKDVEADSPDDADMMFGAMSFDMFEFRQWINNVLVQVLPPKKRRKSGDPLDTEILIELNKQTQLQLW